MLGENHLLNAECGVWNAELQCRGRTRNAADRANAGKSISYCEFRTRIVNGFNQVDATYRADLRELNELNFARFDAKLEQRIAQLDAKLEQRLAEVRTELVKQL